MPSINNPSYPGYILIQDIEPSANVGTASVANAYQTRVLNTIIEDTLNLCSLASNQFTLKGNHTYRLQAKAPCYRTNRHMLQLYNITTSAVEAIGSQEYADYNNLVGNSSFLYARISLAVDTTFELQQFTEVAYLEGLGVGGKAAEGNDSVFAQVMIEVEE